MLPLPQLEYFDSCNYNKMNGMFNYVGLFYRACPVSESDNLN
jgi:hypothetical protein